MSNQLLGSSTSQTTNYVKSRNQSLPSSTRARTTPKSSRSSSLYQKKCIFCKPTASKKTSQMGFSSIISKALYSKYSASQNYHYTRLVNDLLLNAKTSKVIEFQDWEHFDEEEEYLKRFYQLSEYNMKLKTLTEYYKFHKDIARMFMRPVTDILNRYHDKKRRIEYIRITKLLQEEEQEGSISKHENSGAERPKDSQIVDRVLDELDQTNFVSKNSEANFQKNLEDIGITNRVTYPSMKGTQSIYINESAKSDLVNRYLKDQAAQKLAAKNEDDLLKKSHELSVSNTIHELNLKLGEIINSTNSPFVNLDVPNFLEKDNILSELVENVRRKQKTRNPINIVNIDLIKPTQQSSKPTLCTSPVDYKNTEHGINEEDNLKVRTLIKSLKDEKLEGSIPKTSTAAILRKSHRKTPNPENKETQEDETSFVMLSTERLATRKNSLVKDKPRKKTPSIAKIKGFEEAFAMQQQGSLSKANSQRSLSGEKVRKKSKMNTTRKHNDEKVKIKEEGNSGAMPGFKRRESNMNSKDLSKSNADTGRKEKSVTNNRCSHVKPKQVNEVQDLKTKKSTRASSHKKMRITLDINHSGKHPSQHISFNNSNLTGTGKAISLASQTKGFSRNLNNFNVKIASDKALTSRTAQKSDRETKNVLGLESTVKKDYQDFISKRSKLHSRLSSRERSNSHEKSKGSEDGIVNMKKSTEQFYEKLTKRRTSKNLTHLTKTKSEESLNKQNLTEKLKDASKTQKSQNLQGLKSEEDKNVFEDKGDQKHVFTYNNSNVVNIFVQPGDKMLMEEPFLIITKNDRPKSTMRSKPTKHAADNNDLQRDVRKQSQHQCEKLQDLCDEYKYERTSKSPLKSSRKSKPKLSKSKSGTLEPFGRTTVFSQPLREECL